MNLRSHSWLKGAANGPLALLLFAVAVAGCKSDHTYYISPRLTGRVVHAETREPLTGVVIRRLERNYDPTPDSIPKGGELAELNRGVWTDAGGRFVLESRRNISLFSHASWWSVTITCEKSGFDRFRTNFTLSQSTISASGEPLVDAGDISLHPVRR